MKEGWETKKLVDICKIQYGYPFDSKRFCDDSKCPQLIRIRDVSRGYSETYYSGEIPEGYYIEKGDYLIGMDGEFNIAAWNSERALLNQRVCKITANKEAYDRFLYYNLRIILKQIEDETPFVTVKHLSAKRLNTVTINLPPLSEQQHIVEELDLLSSIIEKKKAQLNELDNLAQSLFYEMFGDPITNEKGWEVKKIGEIAESKIGITYKPTDVNDEGIIVLRSSNIQNSEIDLEDIVRVNCNIKDEKYVRDGDILMCTRNGSFRLVGKVAMINNLPERMTYGAFMTIIRSRYNDFLFMFFQLPAFRQQLATAQTATINQITVKMLSDVMVIVPPMDLQQEFASKIEAINHQKELIKQSIKEVETLFNSRMDYYFN